MSSQEDYEDYDSAEEDDKDAQETVKDVKENPEVARETANPATAITASDAAAVPTTAATLQPALDPDDESSLSTLVKELKVTSLAEDKLKPSTTDVTHPVNGTVEEGEGAESTPAEGKPRKWLGVW